MVKPPELNPDKNSSNMKISEIHFNMPAFQYQERVIYSPRATFHHEIQIFTSTEAKQMETSNHAVNIEGILQKPEEAESLM